MSAAAVAALASGVAIGLFVATKVSETHILFTQLAKSMKKVKKTAIKKKRSRKHTVPVIYDDDYTGRSFAELRSELDDLRTEARLKLDLLMTFWTSHKTHLASLDEVPKVSN